MRRSVLLVIFVALASVPAASLGSQEGPSTLRVAPPSWYTSELHQRVLAAGPQGVDVKVSPNATELNCLGTAPPYAGTQGASVQAVSAGTCMVYPSGCTMSFIFADATSKFIGTAGHCVGSGGAVVVQVATRVDPTDSLPIVTLAAIGNVAKRVNNGIGRDFALVKIDPSFKVMPGMAGAAGPVGAFCGDPVGQPVVHYGHGYIFFVEQGHPKVGEVIPDLHPTIKFTSTSAGYNWAGYGLPGDSGSGVMDAAGLAVGNLTHGLSVLNVPIPGLSFGTTMSGIFGIIGSSYGLVTVDGRVVKCPGIAGLVGV